MNEFINEEKVETKTIPTKEKVTYLYNILQINYYLSHGICPKQIGINSTTKRVWAEFSWEGTTEIFGKWCARKKENNTLNNNLKKEGINDGK